MNESETVDKKEKWIEVSLLINPESGEMYAMAGDRAPCSHGYPPCCDTEYLGLEWIKRCIDGKFVPSRDDN